MRTYGAAADVWLGSEFCHLVIEGECGGCFSVDVCGDVRKASHTINVACESCVLQDSPEGDVVTQVEEFEEDEVDERHVGTGQEVLGSQELFNRRQSAVNGCSDLSLVTRRIAWPSDGTLQVSDDIVSHFDKGQLFRSATEQVRVVLCADIACDRSTLREFYILVDVVREVREVQSQSELDVQPARTVEVRSITALIHDIFKINIQVHKEKSDLVSEATDLPVTKFRL